MNKTQRMEEEAKVVAETILEQITAGVRMRLGCRERFHGRDEKGNQFLQFRAGPNRPHFKFRITLMPSDTYRVQLFKVRGIECQTLADHEDVYNDSLPELLVSIEGQHLVS